MYAKAFFDLQLEFAETVSALSGLPLARTVLEYTNFYIRFGFGRDLIRPIRNGRSTWPACVSRTIVRNGHTASTRHDPRLSHHRVSWRHSGASPTRD